MLNSNEHVLEYVDAYVHDALVHPLKHQVAQHCEVCPICRVALEEARKRLDALHALPSIEASESLIQATQQRIQRQPNPRITPVRVALAAAAAVLLLGVVNWYYVNVSPAPFDLRVLGQTDLLAGSEASLRVLFLDPRSGAPRTGVPIAIDLLGVGTHGIAHLASFTTDQFGSGTVRMQLPDWSPGKYQLRVSAEADNGGDSVTENVTLRRSWQLMLTSDKPVYQPGQVIHLRSLGLAEPQRKPVAGREVIFSVTDPKGNVVFRQHDVTSRFGIAWANCPLADEILEGPYQAECELGDTKSAVTLEVRKYVLPKLKVAVELDHSYYQPGQKVRGTVSARYVSGKPVENGEAEIVANGLWPEGSAAAGNAAVDAAVHDAEPSLAAVNPLAHTTARTDASGNATFEFVLPPSLPSRPRDSGDARFSLTVTVHDAAGQKQAATLSRTVTEQPIHIEVIPDGGTMIQDMPNTVYFLTTYPDGQPAPTRINVSGFHEELKTNELGAASLEFAPTSKTVQWLVRADDAAGQTGRRNVSFECGTPEESFLVRTDRAVYDGGQTMHVTALAGRDGPVFIDLIKDGQTMLTAAIPVMRGRGEYPLDLPPELFGTIELSAYRFGKQNLPVIQNRVIYVRPAGNLKIETKFDQPEYRPGTRAKLTVQITDEQGKPVPGAVSLNAVDEAVYSVLPHVAGVEPLLSSVEQKLLKPVYAIYPWSPDSKSDLPPDERNRFERALFAGAGQQQSERNAVLQQAIRKFAENNQRLLDVLQRPDWEDLAESMPFLQKYMPLLRGNGTDYTLCESSYRENARKVNLVRDERAKLMGSVWTVLGVVVGLTVFIWILRFMTGSVVAALLLIFGSFVLFAILLPAVQSAREAAYRNSAAGDLRQIGLALENDPVASYVVRAGRADSTPFAISPARVREWFPETLLWRPELVTDDNGRASLDIDLADSITTWRLSASAVSAEGKLGGAQSSIRVFQPFFVDVNLPVALTRGDEVAVPVVVYNYLDKPQSVELELADAPWFERLDGPAQKLELAAGEVRSLSYRLRAKQIGRHELTVRASGGGVADAIKRTIDVVSDGRRVERTASGTLHEPAEIHWSVPGEAIRGSVKANLRLYPSTFSQLVDGMEGIFQAPYGCFEQTSSTTYPNVLALDYLRRTNKSLPKTEETARQYIHLGYQRLLSFEIAGGGFDWFGRPPANRTLTAYGLMEFTDMARVHDEVDPKLIQRTRDWLLAQQLSDGTWAPESHGMHEDPTRHEDDLATLSTTAYIAWAVFHDEAGGASEATWTRQFLLKHEPASIEDPYVVALVANALLAMNSNDGSAQPYVARLEQLCRRSEDGKRSWWEQGSGRRTMFYGAGRGGSVETTALAALAMIHGHASPGTVRGALAWLIEQKDPRGTWYSTQATVLALKALLAGTDHPLGEAKPRQFDVSLDGKSVKTLVIPADEGDVTKQIDLSTEFASGVVDTVKPDTVKPDVGKPISHRLTISERTDSAAGYQATLVYNVPSGAAQNTPEPLAIHLDYDKTSLVVNDRMTATAKVTNRMPGAAPMVMLDLPIPAGFALEAEDFESLLTQNKIAKYQVTPRSTIVYLRALAPAEPLELTYHLRATMPVKLTAPPARAYEYYDPDHQAFATSTALTVTAAR